MVSPVRGLRYWRAARRLHRKDSEATDRDATATGKGIGDGREHATHVGVGSRARPGMGLARSWMRSSTVAPGRRRLCG